MTTPARARTDLTRWNRAGLSRLHYVDANAPVFLEHLRSAMIARFLRGVDSSEDWRQAGFWFDHMNGRDADALPASVIRDHTDRVDWSALVEGLADGPEGPAARNRRLIENYKAQSEDYATEMLRAFARASHILAGYIDAYVNEGYLSTATQWDSLHKLGQMVNYAPAPAASAADIVALLAAEESGAREIKAGLAMSATPPAGGAPVVFETLDDIITHPDLNAARIRGHDQNFSEVFTNRCRFTLGKDNGPSPGTPVLFGQRNQATFPKPKAGVVAGAMIATDGKTVDITMEEPRPTGLHKVYTQLWYGPEQSNYALPLPSADVIYLNVPKDLNIEVGSLVQLDSPQVANDVFPAIVASLENGRLGLKVQLDLGSASAITVTRIRPMAFYPIDQGWIDIPVNEDGAFRERAYFVASGRIEDETIGQIGVTMEERRTGIVVVNYNWIFWRFAAPPGSTWGGVVDVDGDWIAVTKFIHPPFITSDLNDPETIVSFRGKPPKSLSIGSYYLARRQNDEHIPLKVEGFRVDDGEYTIAFDRDPGVEPDKILFMGPLKSTLDPVDFDRDPDGILDPQGGVRLTGLSEAALDLLRIGKPLLIEDERPGQKTPLAATITGTSTFGASNGEILVELDSPDSALSQFVAGWTLFRLNTVAIGHGETKGAKTLGSGNGERLRQVMVLDVKDISFTADARAAAGVVPDIDVRVDGTLWDYADLTDPRAEDTNSYSIRPRDDGMTDIVFRRRLPSGRNNISVSRHRVGVGGIGNGLGPGAFIKPKSKHRVIEKIVQPFTTSGGGDGETAASIRDSAGAAIAANDRAVSLADFARLMRRHSSVWDASAHEVLDDGRTGLVEITVVPVGGGPLGTLEDGLRNFLTARILPGTRLALIGFTPLPVTMGAQIRADLANWPEDVLRDACEAALMEAFTLRARRLGQPIYVAEILAALEAIDGVETATAQMQLPLGVTLPDEQMFTSDSGAIRAIYPDAGQVVFLTGPQGIELTIGGLG